MTTRAIIDYAAHDDPNGFRDALYGEIMDRVNSHIEAHKQEVARSMIVDPQDHAEEEMAVENETEVYDETETELDGEEE